VATGRWMWGTETGPFSTNIIDLVILITGQSLSRVFVYEDDNSYDKSGPPGAVYNMMPVVPENC
jgi:hypothetical protein